MMLSLANELAGNHYLGVGEGACGDAHAIGEDPGADICTLPEWVEEFEAARLEMGIRKPARPIMRTARQAAAAHRRACEMLDRMGCK